MKVVETFGACSRSIYVQLTKKKQAYVYIHAFYIAACKVRSTCVVWIFVTVSCHLLWRFLNGFVKNLKTYFCVSLNSRQPSFRREWLLSCSSCVQVKGHRCCVGLVDVWIACNIQPFGNRILLKRNEVITDLYITCMYISVMHQYIIKTLQLFDIVQENPV